MWSKPKTKSRRHQPPAALEGTENTEKNQKEVLSADRPVAALRPKLIGSKAIE
jgi:hypothetical protein